VDISGHGAVSIEKIPPVRLNAIFRNWHTTYRRDMEDPFDGVAAVKGLQAIMSGPVA
jgi:hypothetical protein